MDPVRHDFDGVRAGNSRAVGEAVFAVEVVEGGGVDERAPWAVEDRREGAATRVADVLEAVARLHGERHGQPHGRDRVRGPGRQTHLGVREGWVDGHIELPVGNRRLHVPVLDLHVHLIIPGARPHVGDVRRAVGPEEGVARAVVRLAPHQHAVRRACHGAPRRAGARGLERARRDLDVRPAKKLCHLEDEVRGRALRLDVEEVVARHHLERRPLPRGRDRHAHA
mmetsp:Transcript_58603/g.139993  ORF Transcript_58603/g.139993 Transcript_58603/m.139993 type:complete len:225 (+) Transcript_58603:1866-2540(+)